MLWAPSSNTPWLGMMQWPRFGKEDSQVLYPAGKIRPSAANVEKQALISLSNTKELTKFKPLSNQTSKWVESSITSRRPGHNWLLMSIKSWWRSLQPSFLALSVLKGVNTSPTHEFYNQNWASLGRKVRSRSGIEQRTLTFNDSQTHMQKRRCMGHQGKIHSKESQKSIRNIH